MYVYHQIDGASNGFFHTLEKLKRKLVKTSIVNQWSEFSDFLNMGIVSECLKSFWYKGLSTLIFSSLKSAKALKRIRQRGSSLIITCWNQTSSKKLSILTTAIDLVAGSFKSQLIDYFRGT